jgi:hypothetical protein
VTGDTLFLDGNGDVTFDNTNTGGTVYISGNIKLTNNGTLTALVDTSRYEEADNAAAVLAAAVVAPIEANIKQVNDVTIQGTGAVGTDEWRKV